MKLSWTRRVALVSAVATLGLGTTVTLASNAHATTAAPYLARYPGAFVTVEYQAPSGRWNTAVLNAIAQWNQASNVKLTPYPSPRHSDGSSCVPDARSIRICVGNFAPGAISGPGTFFSGGHGAMKDDWGLPVVSLPTSATNIYRTSGASWTLNTAVDTLAPGGSACLFIGQALGLAWRVGGGPSCMNINSTAAIASPLDISLLNTLYAKP
jgi:hypothetical protein